MSVLVTGAAGRLGRVLMPTLRAAGVAVRATDQRTEPGWGDALQLADLSAPAQVAPLMEGVDTLVHLGNVPGVGLRGSLATLNLNSTINATVFHAALAAGVGKVIFASSIQVIAGEDDPTQPRQPPQQIAYLPLDSDSPARPTNGYALSKYFGEVMLREQLAPAGVRCVAVRFPWLSPDDDGPVEVSGEPKPQYRDYRGTRWAQCHAQLTMSDAADLVLALLRADLPGFRVYLPAVSRIRGPVTRRYLEDRYADVPLRRPIEQMDSMIDLSRVTAETGWRPRHVAPVAEPEPRPA